MRSVQRLKLHVPFLLLHWKKMFSLIIAIAQTTYSMRQILFYLKFVKQNSFFFPESLISY